MEKPCVLPVEIHGDNGWLILHDQLRNKGCPLMVNDVAEARCVSGRNMTRWKEYERHAVGECLACQLL